MLSRCQVSAPLRTASSSLLDALPIKTISRTSRRRPTAPIASSSRCFSMTMANGNAYTKSRRSDSESLWSEGSWDDVFQDINAQPLRQREREREPRRPARSRGPRRATMNERESKVLSDMMDMVWSSRQLPPTGRDLNTGLNSSGASDSIGRDSEQGIDRGKVSDLFSQLLRYSRQAKKYRPSNELLDKKKEQMSTCSNDQELLEWAQREVFDESRKFEEEAKKAVAEAQAKGIEIELPYLQSPSYPHMIAHLMRTLRVQFRDPNLAIFIFKHAQNLSTASYVFGCSTGAYNELIETRWSSFKDLEGVLAAVEEMHLNGVPINETTHKLIEQMRRELGETEILADVPEAYNEKNWAVMSKIQEIIAPVNQRRFNKRRNFHEWKSEKGRVDVEDTLNDWSFEALDEFGREEDKDRQRSARSRSDRNRESYKDNDDNIFLRR